MRETNVGKILSFALLNLLKFYRSMVKISQNVTIFLRPTLYRHVFFQSKQIDYQTGLWKLLRMWQFSINRVFSDMCFQSKPIGYKSRWWKLVRMWQFPSTEPLSTCFFQSKKIDYQSGWWKLVGMWQFYIDRVFIDMFVQSKPIVCKSIKMVKISQNVIIFLRPTLYRHVFSIKMDRLPIRMVKIT